MGSLLCGVFLLRRLFAALFVLFLLGRFDSFFRAGGNGGVGRFQFGKGAGGKVAQDRLVHHAVGIDDGAFRSVARVKGIDEDIFGGKHRLDRPYVFFEICSQFFHIRSMFLF